jgi:hypothetical protein
LAVFIVLLGPAAIAGFAQRAMNRHPSNDQDKIADALRAGPNFITKDATILDWPSTPGGEYRVWKLRNAGWAPKVLSARQRHGKGDAMQQFVPRKASYH